MALLPDWWIQANIPKFQRDRLMAQFTVQRDGYYRWYAGKARFACGRKTPPDEVEEQWEKKRQSIDRKAAGGSSFDADAITYRQALSEFLKTQEARIGAPKKRIAERTYHNYTKDLNEFGSFEVEGAAIADLKLKDIGPRHFSAYAGKFKTWKASGFDSIVCRVSALFRWAAEMEYIDRFRPGPDFVRPAKQDIRDDRLSRERAYTAEEVAKLYHAANATMRCWIALGVCAGFSNSDIGHVTRSVLGVESGIIDFRRRKRGKIRRVVPLPDDVVIQLRNYVRPDPSEKAWGELFFITAKGNPYSHSRNGFKPSDSVSRLFPRLITDAGIEKIHGRNFSGLRTTFANLAPGNLYRDEIAIIMGHSKGTVFLDHYIEKVGYDRLKACVAHVWDLVLDELNKLRAGEARSAAVVSV
jgi:integrase